MTYIIIPYNSDLFFNSIFSYYKNLGPDIFICRYNNLPVEIDQNSLLIFLYEEIYLSKQEISKFYISLERDTLYLLRSTTKNMVFSNLYIGSKYDSYISLNLFSKVEDQKNIIKFYSQPFRITEPFLLYPELKKEIFKIYFFKYVLQLFANRYIVNEEIITLRSIFKSFFSEFYIFYLKLKKKKYRDYLIKKYLFLRPQ